MSGLDDRAVLVAVIDSGSFTAGARRLGISTSYASRRVRALEQRLGAALVVRNTRQLRLTEVGARYVERVGALLRSLDEADQEASSARVVPSGRLRVAAPLSFGLLHVRPVLTELQLRYPALRVEASFSDYRVDPMRFDVTIRGGVLGESGLMARRLCPMAAWLAASDAYLASAGSPANPAELSGHRLLRYAASSAGHPWRFTRGEEQVEIEVEPVFLADNGDALIAAAEAGLGVVHEPDFLLAPAIRRGTLRRLLPDWTGFTSAFWAIRSARHPSAAVQALVDALVARLGDPDDAPRGSVRG